MPQDKISIIGIDKDNHLYVIPSKLKFRYIYREAMDVHWHEEGSFLYSPAPSEWSYFDCYKQIVSAVRKQSTLLLLDDETEWKNIPNSLRAEISNFMGENFK